MVTARMLLLAAVAAFAGVEARADRHHAYYGAHSKHDPDGGEKCARLLRPQVSESLAQIGEQDHLVNAFITPPESPALPALF